VNKTDLVRAPERGMGRGEHSGIEKSDRGHHSGIEKRERVRGLLDRID